MFRSAYSGSVRSSLSFDGDEVLTEQSHLKSTDINHIVSQYQRTGIAPQSMSDSPPRFGDISSLPSLQDGLNAVISAQESFDSLPSDIRKRFSNDPSMLLSAIEESSTNELLRSELVSYGILNAPPTPVIPDDPIPSPEPSDEV